MIADVPLGAYRNARLRYQVAAMSQHLGETVERMMALDLPDDIFVKVDRAAMGLADVVQIALRARQMDPPAGPFPKRP